MVDWIWLIICLFCAMIFIIIGIYAIKSKKPMHFWSGSTVSPSEIRDIPKYNKANGIMWILYSSIFVLSGILGFIGEMMLATALMLIGCVAGIPVLIIAYNKIYKKYKA